MTVVELGVNVVVVVVVGGDGGGGLFVFFACPCIR